MISFGGRVPVDNDVPAGDVLLANDTAVKVPQTFKRVLIPVLEASKAEDVIELAQRVGATEARVLHLNLHESIRGRHFAMESDSSASYVVEATVFELQMAGIGASGVVRHAIVDRAAEAIVAEAEDWGADLIVLGHSRRGELATRLYGSVTLRVLQHATCPVVVASPAKNDRTHRISKAA